MTREAQTLAIVIDEKALFFWEVSNMVAPVSERLNAVWDKIEEGYPTSLRIRCGSWAEFEATEWSAKRRTVIRQEMKPYPSFRI